MNFYFSADTNESPGYKIVYERISKNSVQVNIEKEIRSQACEGLYHLMLRQENRIPIDICGSGKKDEIEYISFLIRLSEVKEGLPPLDIVSHPEYIKIRFPECDPIRIRYVNEYIRNTSMYCDDSDFIYLFDDANGKLHQFSLSSECAILLNARNYLKGIIVHDSDQSGFTNIFKGYNLSEVPKEIS